MKNDLGPPSLKILLGIFVISFAAIAWQIGLMRCLIISKYHHFSFLVISCALLGFGLGGVLLSVTQSRLQRNFSRAFAWGALIFCVSLPLFFYLGERLPVRVYFPPINATGTLAWWFLYWTLHGIPFLFAGFLIGLALTCAGRDVHKVYFANLVGSAAGALGSILILALFAPTDFVLVSSGLVLMGLAVFIIENRKLKLFYFLCSIGTASSLVVLALLGSDSVFKLNVDEYKSLAYVNNLKAQGSAKQTARYNGPRGLIQLFSGPHFHTLLSLGGGSLPPPMDVVLVNGFQAGVIPAINDVSDAGFLSNTLSALPYKICDPESVLILGETGSVHLWLARMSTASKITLVHPDRNIFTLLENHPSGVMRDSRIKCVTAEPRAYLDWSQDRFDIIQFAALEGFSAGSGGIGGLREDYLGTVEGYSRCPDRLTIHGIACSVRGIQDPERDNLKIAGTWIQALRNRDTAAPGNNLLVARDELSMATLVSGAELTPDMVRKFRMAVKDASWEAEWFPGVMEQDTNKTHVLPGPPDSPVSWYHFALMRFLSGQGDSFYERWIFDVRPATDDKPFFYDFFKWESLGKLKDAFGPLWPARAEAGFLIILAANAWSIISALLLLPIPVGILLRSGKSDGVTILSVTAYFAALGSAFMFVEVGFIQLFTRFLGDPIIAAALVVGGFLFFAGVGSFFQPQVVDLLSGRVIVVTLMIGTLTLADALVIQRLFTGASGSSMELKSVLSIMFIAPLAFLMGIPFPWGLRKVQSTEPAVIPLAWAVNGFASVISSSAEMIVAMTYGFRVLFLAAAVTYVAAGLISLALDGKTSLVGAR